LRTQRKKNSSEKKRLFAIEINQLIEWCKYDNRMMSMMSETGRQIGAGFFQIFQWGFIVWFSDLYVK